MEFFIGLIIAILIALFVFKSLKLAIKFFINIVVGSIFLMLFNSIAIKYGLSIETSPMVMFFVGLFGLPAVIILVIMKIFI